MEPGFLLSYWRPWDENSSFVDSWGDYLRDKSMVEYGAQKIGSFIKEASREQVHATMQAARTQSMATVKAAAIQVDAIQKAATMIGYQLEDVKKELKFLNRRMDISIEQQRVSLMLQDNIAQLLKIPNSEKERQQAITLGIQFFVNASKNPELFDDALEEFLKAESMKKQDYFVLHRIGCIYMFTQKHMDIPKALDYFQRAGKYSSVESDPSALRLANILTNSINSEYTQHTSDPKSIQLLAGDSFEKAALASYIIGDDKKAIDYQKMAITYNPCPENRFKLGKYLVRSGDASEALKQLNYSISRKPELINAIVSDVDTANNPKVIGFVEKKVQEADLSLNDAFEKLLERGEEIDVSMVSDVVHGERLSYAVRMQLINTIKKMK